MADRNADNDNEAAGSEAPDGDNWVLPVPPKGPPSFALIPWSLFERLRRGQQMFAEDTVAPLGPGDDPTSAIAKSSDAAIPVALEDDLAFAAGSGSDLWAKTEEEIDGYVGDPAQGAIPLHLLDRLLDGEHPLKVFRRHRGLTQKELAERTGLNATYLSQIETRKRGGSTRVYRLLAAALNVEIGDLIE